MLGFEADGKFDNTVALAATGWTRYLLAVELALVDYSHRRHSPYYTQHCVQVRVLTLQNCSRAQIEINNISNVLDSEVTVTVLIDIQKNGNGE